MAQIIRRNMRDAMGITVPAPTTIIVLFVQNTENVPFLFLIYCIIYIVIIFVYCKIKEVIILLFSGYLSKHLYGRIVSSQSESIKTPLDDEELKALKKFKVSYKIVFNNDGEPIYILDTQELKSIFCN